jgi:beta-phosphoglucomutase
VKSAAVLWDLDGTLVDTRDLHWRAWRETMAAEGIAITEADFLESFGRRNEDNIGRWLGSGADPDRARRVAEDREIRFRALVRSDGVRACPGAEDWIRTLDRAGWRQAVASSAPRASVGALLAAVPFAGTLSTIVGAEDVTAGKPAPDVFTLAASRLGVDASRCVVVEDAPAGVEAARRAGMRAIGVGGRVVVGADIVVDSLAALPVDAFDRLVSEDRTG